MRTNWSYNVLKYGMPFLPVAAYFVVRDQMAEQVPIHFNLQGKPDNFASPQTLFWILTSMAIVTVFVNVLLSKMKGKLETRKGSSVYEPLTWVITFAFTALGAMGLAAAVKGEMVAQNILVPGLLVFMALLGNYMINIKPNYWVGIRTPRTLRNPDVWRKTHRFSGKWLFITSLLALSPLPFIQNEQLFTYFIVVVIVQMSVSLLYSFVVKADEK